MNDKWNTRQSLILRASNPDDHQAFEEFTFYYEGFIKIVLHKFGISAADQQDLQQQLLVKLWKGLSKFNEKHENKNFRGWLGVVIRNETYNFFKSQKRYSDKIVNDSEYLSSFADEDKAQNVDSMIEQEWKAYVTSLAMEHLKSFFSGNAMSVFSLTLQDKTVEEICDELNLKKDSVYMLRARVKSRFQKEVKSIRQLLEPSSDQ